MATRTPQTDVHRATWQFPTNQDGAEYGFGDAAAAHFRADPMTHLVREMLQNSMDAKVDGLYEPVRVVFKEIDIPTDVIGADSLRPHFESCLELAKERKQSETAIVYANALKVLNQSTASCLCVIDSGTTGLVDDNWRALVIQEGIAHKEQGRIWRIKRHRQERCL